MREILYNVRQAYAQDGRRLMLAYSVLVEREGGDGPEHFGVKIEERNCGDQVQALDVTTDAKQAYTFVDQLAKNTVTPTGLLDVLADWL